MLLLHLLTSSSFRFVKCLFLVCIWIEYIEIKVHRVQFVCKLKWKFSSTTKGMHFCWCWSKEQWCRSVIWLFAVFFCVCWFSVHKFFLLYEQYTSIIKWNRTSFPVYVPLLCVKMWAKCFFFLFRTMFRYGESK